MIIVKYDGTTIHAETVEFSTDGKNLILDATRTIPAIEVLRITDHINDTVKGETTMKHLYIAREEFAGTDYTTAHYTLEAARESARGMFDHLTRREREKALVTVETYAVNVPADDPRDAETLYSDLLDVEAPEIQNSVDFEQITERVKWLDYMFEHPSENLSWCKPYADADETCWLIMHDGIADSIDTPDGTVHNFGGSDFAAALEALARRVNPHYDDYSGWTDEHIALEVMHETGCRDCPFREECEPMQDYMDEADYR